MHVLVITLIVTATLLAAMVADLAAASKGSAQPRGVATPKPDDFDPQRDYDRSRASDLIRANHGSIFFARVDSLESEDMVPVAEGVPPHRVLTYLVTVDRSLVGDVEGQVPIVYFGAYQETYDNGGFGPLRIGERYLFFAGSDEAGTEYFVQAGTGTILITKPRQDDRLARKYLPLIAEAELREQEVIARATARATKRQAHMEATPVADISKSQAGGG